MYVRDPEVARNGRGAPNSFWSSMHMLDWYAPGSHRKPFHCDTNATGPTLSVRSARWISVSEPRVSVSGMPARIIARSYGRIPRK